MDTSLVLPLSGIEVQCRGSDNNWRVCVTQQDTVLDGDGYISGDWKRRESMFSRYKAKGRRGTVLWSLLYGDLRDQSQQISVFASADGINPDTPLPVTLFEGLWFCETSEPLTIAYIYERTERLSRVDMRRRPYSFHAPQP